MCWPRCASPPEVDRRVTTQPAKSVSTDLVISELFGWKEKTHIILRLPFKYATNRFNMFTEARVGEANERHIT